MTRESAIQMRKSAAIPLRVYQNGSYHITAPSSSRNTRSSINEGNSRSDGDRSMRQEIKALLTKRTVKRINDPTGRRASVLVPLFKKDDSYHILFAKRTKTVRYHKGEVSFPGGSYDEVDQTLETTAYRETFEEIGVEKENIEMLGELDETRTVTSNFIVSAFVGYLDYPQITFKLHKAEVAELIEAPVPILLDPNNVRKESHYYAGSHRLVYFYQYNQHVIWGATARILKQFLELIAPLFPTNISG